MYIYSHKEGLMVAKIYMLIGDVNSGKSSVLSKWVDEYKEEGRLVGGVLAPAHWFKGEKVYYDAIDIETGKRHIFASTKPISEAEAFGRFWFSKRGKQLAERAITKIKENYDVGIVDEIGSLELEGKGLARAFKAVLTHPPKKLIISVRESLVDDVVRAFGLNRFEKLNVLSQKP